MNTDDEKIFAWLDGELSGAEAAEVEAAVDSDPRLARLAEQHRALRARLTSAFDTVARAPVPERLAAAVRRPGDAVVDFATAARRRERRSWLPIPQWAAIAATLVLGVALGTTVRSPSSSPVEVVNGKVYAAAGLDKALDTQLASAPAGGDLRVGLTFRDQQGAVCRSFTGTAASGLACRSDGKWRVRGLFAAPEGQGSDYRMAGGMDPALAALIDSTLAGEPFDADQEKAAKEKGWR